MPDERSIDDVIAEVRRLAANATPGPWQYYERGHPSLGYDVDGTDQHVIPVGLRGMFGDEGDAAFIVAACNNALRLCDEIERLTTMLEALPGLIEQVQTYSDDGEVIVLTQASYNQLREDAGWPVVWSSKKPKNVQEWRAFMKGDE